MNTKDRVLTLLTACKGAYLSGEELAQSLKLSRAAVWKAVSALKEMGLPIKTQPGKGYCLEHGADFLTRGGIESRLEPCSNWSVQVFGEVTSTNAVLRQQASAGAPDGTVLIAGSQSQGRGRLGRSFYSPADTGVYLSVLLRRDWGPLEARRLTTMAALAACRAVQQVAGKKAGIKWVNDVFLEGKKVCGILTEAAFSLEDGKLEYAVVGAGFNANCPSGGFPEELASIAGAVFDAPQEEGRNRLAAAFLNAFAGVLADPQTYPQAYKENCLVLGKTVLAGTRRAKALDLDENCGLLVQYEDGSRETLTAGEISVKL